MFTNAVFNNVVVTINGEQHTLAPNDTFAMSGKTGDELQYTAYALSDPATGAPAGADIHWEGTLTLTHSYKSVAYFSTLSADTTKMHVWLTNSSGHAIDQMVVKADGNPNDSSIYPINIPSDSTQYALGYYRRDTTTIISLYGGGMQYLANDTVTLDSNYTVNTQTANALLHLQLKP